MRGEQVQHGLEACDTEIGRESRRVLKKISLQAHLPIRLKSDDDDDDDDDEVRFGSNFF